MLGGKMSVGSQVELISARYIPCPGAYLEFGPTTFAVSHHYALSLA